MFDEFYREKIVIAKHENVKQHEVKIVENSNVENLVVYIKDKFWGYIDNEFYDRFSDELTLGD